MPGWGKWPLTALITGAAMFAAPAAGSAVTVTLGPPDLGALVVGYAECPKCQSYGALNTAAGPGTRLTAPGDGTITSWAAVGAGEPALHLIVFTPQSDGTMLGSTLSTGGLVDGTRNSTSQPIAIGDTIGISTIKGEKFKETETYGVAAGTAVGSSWAEIGAFFEGQRQAPLEAMPNQQLLYNATVQLFAPSLTSIAPNAGSAGTVVTISGQHLAIATGVMFGGVPATSFTGNNEQITAVAPPHAGGAVDVQVTTAGGTSVGLPLDLFVYPNPIPPASPLTDRTPPTVGSLAVSPSSFRAARSGASVIASRVGTRVSDRLSEPATTTFVVQRVLAGRRSGKRCVAPSRSNRGKRRCTRLKSVRGSFTRAAATGANSFTFTGRIGGKALSRGSYRLVATAVDAAGNRSKPAARAFSIVR